MSDQNGRPGPPPPPPPPPTKPDRGEPEKRSDPPINTPRRPGETK